MLWIVIVRAEATRVHYLISALDGRESVLLSEIQRERAELARWQSPTLIRDRLRELRLPALGLPVPAAMDAVPRPAPKTPKAKPKPAAKSGAKAARPR